MSIRSGMEALIRKLRHLGQAGMEDYQIVDEVYWSDQHIQDVLDGNKKRITGAGLKAEPEYIDSSDVYKRYVLGFDTKRWMLEGTAGGTSVFRVADSTGETVTGYTWGENDLSVTFASDTDGTAYYLNGYAYDIAAAARDLWLMKASHSWTAINFSADGHRFDRSQMYEHCMRMVDLYEKQSGTGGHGISSTKLKRNDLHGPGDGEHF